MAEHAPINFPYDVLMMFLCFSRFAGKRPVPVLVSSITFNHFDGWGGLGDQCVEECAAAHKRGSEARIKTMIVLHLFMILIIVCVSE